MASSEPRGEFQDLEIDAFGDSFAIPVLARFDPCVLDDVRQQRRSVVLNKQVHELVIGFPVDTVGFRN